jgi:hypothetical protein
MVYFVLRCICLLSSQPYDLINNLLRMSMSVTNFLEEPEKLGIYPAMTVTVENMKYVANAGDKNEVFGPGCNRKYIYRPEYSVRLFRSALLENIKHLRFPTPISPINICSSNQFLIMFQNPILTSTLLNSTADSTLPPFLQRIPYEKGGGDAEEWGGDDGE